MPADKTYLSNRALGLNANGVKQQHRISTKTSAVLVSDNLYDLSIGGIVRKSMKRRTATAYIHIGVGGVYALEDANRIREFDSLSQQGKDYEFKVELPVAGEMAGMANGWTVLIEVDE